MYSDERVTNPHGAPEALDVDPVEYVDDDVPLSEDDVPLTDNIAGVDPADSEDLEYAEEDRPRP